MKLQGYPKKLAERVTMAGFKDWSRDILMVCFPGPCFKVAPGTVSVGVLVITQFHGSIN
jgi:hypothetical protein